MDHCMEWEGWLYARPGTQSRSNCKVEVERWKLKELDEEAWGQEETKSIDIMTFNLTVFLYPHTVSFMVSRWWGQWIWVVGKPFWVNSHWWYWDWRDEEVPMLTKWKCKLEFFTVKKNLHFVKSTTKKMEIQAREKILANIKHCYPEYINYFEN